MDFIPSGASVGTWTMLKHKDSSCPFINPCQVMSINTTRCLIKIHGIQTSHYDEVLVY